MPKRTTFLTQENERLHKNHSFEFLVATWLMQAGWQVFTPLLDAAHGVDLIASDGPNSYRIQIKSLESQDEHQAVGNKWKHSYLDFVIYFAQRSNWGYVCPAFSTNSRRLNDPAHKKFRKDLPRDFLKAFHTCEAAKHAVTSPSTSAPAPGAPSTSPSTVARSPHHLPQPDAPSYLASARPQAASDPAPTTAPVQ